MMKGPGVRGGLVGNTAWWA